MSPWKFFELLGDVLSTVWDFVDFCASWRFWLCFVVAIILASAAYTHMPATLLRPIVAGGIVIVGIIVGNNWEKNS